MCGDDGDETRCPEKDQWDEPKQHIVEEFLSSLVAVAQQDVVVDGCRKAIDDQADCDEVQVFHGIER